MINRGLDEYPVGVSVCASPRGIGALVCAVPKRCLADQHDVRLGDTILSVNDVIGKNEEHILSLLRSTRIVKVRKRASNPHSLLRR